MHDIWFSADTHFFHKKMLEVHNPKRKEVFDDIQSMNERMIVGWNLCVHKEDEVYFLGDFCWVKKEVEPLLKRLNGKMHFILGNHDEDKKSRIEPNVVSMERLSWLKYDGLRVVMCHYPMLTWPSRRNGAVHLHGHCHGTSSKRFNVFDVGADCTGFIPINWETLRKMISEQKHEEIKEDEL